MATKPQKKTVARAKVQPKTSAYHAAPKLHYSKEALVAEYEATQGITMKALAVMVVIAVIYFFVMVAFVGGTNAKHEDFVKQFGDRMTIEYDGKKLPIYEQGN